MIAQEGRHTRSHLDFNRAFEEKTDRDLSRYKDLMTRSFQFISFKGDRRRNMAIFLLFETGGGISGKLLMDSPIFRGLKGEAAKLFRWHFAEEVLHCEEFSPFLEAAQFKLDMKTKLSACIRVMGYFAVGTVFGFMYAKETGVLNLKNTWELFRYFFLKEKLVFIICQAVYTTLSNKAVKIPEDLRNYCLSYLESIPSPEVEVS